MALLEQTRQCCAHVTGRKVQRDGPTLSGPKDRVIQCLDVHATEHGNVQFDTGDTGGQVVQPPATCRRGCVVLHRQLPGFAHRKHGTHVQHVGGDRTQQM